MTESQKHYLPLMLLVISLVAMFWAYSLGISGAFLLDDYATLPFLAQWGEIDTFGKLSQFVGQGFTGPTGRPIALLTFAMQSEAWPNNPEHFLIINLIIHLLNAVVLFCVINIVGRELSMTNDARWWTSLGVAVVWATHPFLVSSVLYIVQRMVLLATFFNLVALLAYVLARRTYFSGMYIKCVLWFGVCLMAAVLAICSKENAVLFPLQLLLIEKLIQWKQPVKPKAGLKFVLFFLWAAAALIFFYLALPLARNIVSLIVSGQELASHRDYSLFERLMTQARVMGDYLLGFLVPRSQTPGVFYDAYPISKSLINPISTLIWLLIHCSLLSFAFLSRRKLPYFSFGILWFYLNHLVESTVIMLELKFEHRNYLPYIGLSVALVALVASLSIKEAGKKAIISAICAILFFLLSIRTSLWGNPTAASLVWVQENPRSLRALENAALILSQRSENSTVVAGLLEDAMRLKPDHPVIALKYFSYVCSRDPSKSLNVDQIAKDLAAGSVDWQVGPVLDEILDKKISGKCEQLALDGYRKILQSVLLNSKYSRTRIPLTINDLMARSELTLGNPQVAVDLYLSADYEVLPLGLVMKQSLWIATYGYLKEAIMHLERGLQSGVGANSFLIEQANDMKAKMQREINHDH